MEWNLLSEQENDLLTDIDFNDAANDELVEESTLSSSKPVSARRAIEILIENKQLNKELSDIFY